MIVKKIRLKNWRNFLELNVPLSEVSYVLGPNASGKSNLLDVFRFLRDVCKPRGGGLQAAVEKRSGMSKLRCLHARQDTEVLIDVELAESADGESIWRYELGFKVETAGARRLLVSREAVWHLGSQILDRPDQNDRKDKELLSQTHLEQIQTNAKFRELVAFFSEVTYLHLVPQLLKFSDRIGGTILEDDPFGQGFLGLIAQTTERTRNARLSKIKKALQGAVPHIEDLRFAQDKLGRPHLEAKYVHFRPNAGWQSEEHFSDGTLRLIGMLWALLDGHGLLLLEEPELSLNEEIVRLLPVMIDRGNRSRKSKRQVIISTHSSALLSNPAIDARGIVYLEAGEQGTDARQVNDTEREELEAGLTVAEVMLPKPRPESMTQLRLWNP